MINKKTIAVKVLQTQSNIEVVLGKLGRVYEVPFSDGRKTLSVILTYEGVRSLGIDLNTIFKGCGGKEVFNEGTDVKNGSTIQQAHGAEQSRSTGSPQDGVLVNLDLYQQVALLRAVIAKKPELQDVLGLYNLRGSRKVYEVLSREGVPQRLDILWMWTGERYISPNDEGDYPEEGIVSLSNLSTLTGRFIPRVIDHGHWFNNYPGDHGGGGAVVFGALR